MCTVLGGSNLIVLKWSLSIALWVGSLSAEPWSMSVYCTGALFRVWLCVSTLVFVKEGRCLLGRHGPGPVYCTVGGLCPRVMSLGL